MSRAFPKVDFPAERLDRNGAAFFGTTAELAKHNDKLRKRAERARPRQPEVILPLPKGTAACLDLVLEAAGFDDPRDFLAFQIHRLAALLVSDRPAFDAQAIRTVQVGSLDKWAELIGQPSEEQNDD